MKSRSLVNDGRDRQGSESGGKRELYSRANIEQMIKEETHNGSKELFGTSEESKIDKDEFELADDDSEGENESPGLEQASRVYVQSKNRMSTVNKTSPRI